MKECHRHNEAGNETYTAYCQIFYFTLSGCSTVNYNVSEGSVCTDYIDLTCKSEGTVNDPCLLCQDQWGDQVDCRTWRQDSE